MLMSVVMQMIHAGVITVTHSRTPLPNVFATVLTVSARCQKPNTKHDDL